MARQQVPMRYELALTRKQSAWLEYQHFAWALARVNAGDFPALLIRERPEVYGSQEAVEHWLAVAWERYERACEELAVVLGNREVQTGLVLVDDAWIDVFVDDDMEQAYEEQVSGMWPGEAPPGLREWFLDRFSLRRRREEAAS